MLISAQALSSFEFLDQTSKFGGNALAGGSQPLSQSGWLTPAHSDSLWPAPAHSGPFRIVATAEQREEASDLTASGWLSG